MARGKKKEAVTLEEKLERALAPAEEQPYEVPKNWCWIHLLDAFDNVTDSKKKLTTKEYLIEGKYPVIDQGQEFIGGYTDNEDVVHESKLPIVIFGDHTRCVKYIDFLFVQGADGVKVLKPKFFWNEKAFYYALQSIEIPNMGYRRHYPLFKDFCIPIPPLAEQKRIVEQVDSLFVKLHEVKEKIQNILDTFENRKAVILYKAFQGTLTGKWRTKKNKKISDWKQKTIKDVCDDIKVGIVIKPTQYYTEPDNGVAAFRSANVREAYIEDENWVYINRIGQQENKRSEVHTGDVLVVRSGNPGTACVVTEEYDGFNAIDIIIAVPDKLQIDSKYLCYYTNSPEVKGLVRENKRGMALPHFNVGGYSKLPIKVPSLEEQHEIVSIIDMELRKEQKSKRIVESVVDKVDIMKKSILAKAFRGELGTNNPDEESSVELLKQMLEQGEKE